MATYPLPKAEPRIVPIILCGGAGTRLWPQSRESFPKQFLPLLGERSTFEETLKRLDDSELFAEPVVVTGEAFRFIVGDQMHRAGVQGRIVLEPARRDSGPAIAAAVEIVHGLAHDALVLVLAADHAVEQIDMFRDTVRAGRQAAVNGAIVTFGITPDHPATGYGYIQSGEVLAGDVRRVARFVEKPDAERAAEFVKAGYLWNSGNFLFRADVFLAELAIHEPLIADAARLAAVNRTVDTGSGISFERIDAEAFKASPAKSVDYAVMERTDRAAVIPAHYSWSDLGSWDSLWEAADKDEAGNAVLGPATLIDTANSFVSSEGAHVAVVGLSDIAVVATPDAVLVSRRDAGNEIKTLVAELRKSAPKLLDEHRRMHRPWGWYQSVDMGERFQVKRIMVKPGARLSLQKHFHRAEHWVVVKGTATVTIDDQVRMVHENESIYIPLGAVHRMANDGRIPLELIEVQSGSYLGEDDIVRLEDDYRRE